MTTETNKAPLFGGDEEVQKAWRWYLAGVDDTLGLTTSHWLNHQWEVAARLHPGRDNSWHVDATHPSGATVSLGIWWGDDGEIWRGVGNVTPPNI